MLQAPPASATGTNGTSPGLGAPRKMGSPQRPAAKNRKPSKGRGRVRCRASRTGGRYVPSNGGGGSPMGSSRFPTADSQSPAAGNNGRFPMVMGKRPPMAPGKSRLPKGKYYPKSNATSTRRPAMKTSKFPITNSTSARPGIRTGRLPTGSNNSTAARPAMRTGQLPASSNNGTSTRTGIRTSQLPAGSNNGTAARPAMRPGRFPKSNSTAQGQR